MRIGSDLFHEDVPVEWIDKMFAVMALSPQHTFQVLTKRAQRMREYLSNDEICERVGDAAYASLAEVNGRRRVSRER